MAKYRPRNPMTITGVTLGTLWVLSIMPSILGLTYEEASLFESDEIPVIPGRTEEGRVAIGNNQDNTHTLISNGIPDNAIGPFPDGDDQNTISEQNFRMKFPQNPEENDNPTCLPANSIIGFATNGVAIFSPFDANGNDLTSVFDANDCPGRISVDGIYYFVKSFNKCSTFARQDHSVIRGVALDGFPIYGQGDTKITGLDECHGKKVNGKYRYYMTDEWPWVLGCFRGTPATIENGPPATGICKFPCSHVSLLSDSYPCGGQVPTTRPPTTTAQRPLGVLGLTSQETTLFASKAFQVLPVAGSVIVHTSSNADRTKTYYLVSNGIPDHFVGTFPNANNPYSIAPQSFSMTFPQYITINAQPSCLFANSIVGFATNGVAIFSPFDYNNNNLNLEFGNNCQGRTSSGGIYYYAQVPDKCNTYIPGYDGHNPNEIYGVALDGFPIYGPGSGSSKITNADLDACHGKFVNGQYRYYITDEWPYVIGCFRGTPVTVSGGPAQTGICKFACNKESRDNTVPCFDSFSTVPPRAPFITTTVIPPMTQPQIPKTGLTSQEANSFESQEIPVIPGSDVYGRVMVIADDDDDIYTLTSNGIPDHVVGIFPNDNNLYPIVEQNFRITFPQNPTMNIQPSCLPANSIIGFATNGVAIFSPFDNNGNDLNIDFGGNCQGRTSLGGIYYYAQVPDKCPTFIPGVRDHDPSRIYGVALDGFPIYGPGPNNDKVTNSELDACHGKLVNGKYGYYMNDEWPYVLGCFRGTPASVEGASPVSGVCKFACNRDSLINTVPCTDSFVTTMKPPIVKSTTAKSTATPMSSKSLTTNLIERLVGITDEEIVTFGSDEIKEPITGERGIAEIIINQETDTITFISNGIPDHATGEWNELSVQNYELTVPRNPAFSKDPGCLPSPGIIGFATNGVAIFSPYDAKGSDLNSNDTNNVPDLCEGRVSSSGIYYYTQLPTEGCGPYKSNPNEIYGVALDGFPIYGPGDPPVDKEDLDVCHGRIVDGQYRYYMTKEFPYIIGCFRGIPQELTNVEGRPTVPPFKDSCRYACNLDGTTAKSDTEFCSVAVYHFASLWGTILPASLALLFSWM